MPELVSTSSSTRARHAAVDDVHRAHALAHGRERRGTTRGRMSGVDHAVAQQRFGLARGQHEREPAVAVVDARARWSSGSAFRRAASARAAPANASELM